MTREEMIRDGIAMGLVDRWWSLAVRGLFAIAFGVLAFALPGGTLFALVILFGCYAIVDGAFTLVAGVKSRRQRRSWGLPVAQGLLGIVAGAVALAWPGITALALLYVIAAWAVVTGMLEIWAAISLRKQIEGEWLLGLTGVLSILLGAAMFAYPGAGALAVVWWIGAYAIAFGVLMIALAFRLRSLMRGAGPHDRTIGGMPHPA
jgi:uncharacterized membrane protein HdeD (DUF308 family)